MTARRGKWSCWHGDCSLEEDAHGFCHAQGLKDHVCNGRLGHQHFPKKSRGGQEIAAILCWSIHDAIDNGINHNGRRLTNDVTEIDGERVYRIIDRDTKEILLTRVLSEAVYAS